jgi:DNA-directed RNA polymerase subunit omega
MSNVVNSFGITYPPIDELLAKVRESEEKTDSDESKGVGSKFALAALAAVRARQIVSYYSQLSDGLLENVGPLVDHYLQEKALSIAMREIHQGRLDLHLGGKVSSAKNEKIDALNDENEDNLLLRSDVDAQLVETEEVVEKVEGQENLEEQDI